MNKMKINLKVRFKNLTYWIMMAAAVVLPVLSYFGLKPQDITTWNKLFDVVVKAISNPYVVICIIGGVVYANIDPTTKGVGDSERALTYDKPSE